MKKLLTTLALAVTLLAAAAENGIELLKNRDFAKNFAGWTVRGERPELDNGSASFSKGKKSYLVQYKLPVAPGRYLMSFTASGSGQYKAYCELHGKVDGKRYYTAPGAKKTYTAAADKKAQQIEFEIAPENVDKIQSFAFVLTYLDGEVNFSGLSLKKVAAQAAPAGAEVLKNGNFERKFAFWTVRVERPELDNGSVSFSKGKSAYLIQYKLPVVPGKYLMSYHVSGSGQYKAYCELHGKVDGKKYYTAPGAKDLLDAPEKGEVRTVEFEVTPENAGKIQSFAFVLNYRSGIVTFRDLSLKKVDGETAKTQSAAAAKPARPASVESVLGGKWRFVNGSFLAGSGATLELNQIGHNQIRRTKLSGIPVKSGASYRFSCRVNGIATGDTLGGFCAFRIVPVSGGKELLAPKWDDTLLSNRQYKHLEFVIPAGSKELEMQFETPGKTVVGFAEFALQEIPAKVPVSSFYLTEPAYRDTVFSSMPLKNISGKVELRGKAVSAVAKLSVDGAETATAPVKADGSFTLPSPGKNCVVSVEFTDAAGKTVSSAGRSVKFLAPGKVEVTVDSQNHIVINGKRFFPVCFWELTAVNEPGGLYFAARNGVNCFILTSRYCKNVEEKKNILDQAHAYGMKVFLQVPSVDKLTDDKLPAYRAALAEAVPPVLKSHPAVIGYFLTDEPMWRGVPQQRVLNGYNAVKEFDPYRIIWINAAPRNTVEAHASYAEAADIYGIDIYPYPYPHSQSGMADKTLTCVGKYTDFCREAVKFRKPVWMALQGFSWHAYYNPDHGEHYPGLNHMRFVTYETLFHGGQAGTIWGTRHIRAAAYYDTLFDLTYEQYLISGLFTRCDKRETVKSTNKEVIAELMHVGSERYLIVRNCHEKPQISWVSGNFPAVRQLLPAGSRRVHPAGDAQVALEPFEVVVFGTAALPEPAYKLPEPDAELDKLANPFKRIVKSDIFKTRYTGSANWIWENGNVAVNSKADLQRNFTIDPAQVKNITLLATADDVGEVWFNGEKVGKLEHFSNMQSFEIPPRLWKKENLVTVRAADSGMLPCGVLAEILITGTDGKVQRIVTDGSWRSGKGEPAVIVAPFGKGAWGRRVNVILKGQ